MTTKALAAMAVCLALFPGGSGSAAQPASIREQSEKPNLEGNADDDVQVVVRQVDESRFPEITLDFEIRRKDGTAILEASKDDLRVTEYDEPVEVLRFEAPTQRISRPTTVVLVVDRSKSMDEEDRIEGLKRSVAAFLENMPIGSKVAVVAFGSEVKLACPFTADPRQVQEAVDRLYPLGGTRFYDAVEEAVQLLSDQPGRKAILALTDGEDTFSQEADLASVLDSARRAGLPVHTLGLGSEDLIASDDLKRLAEGTRGQYFAATDATQLNAIYEEIAQRLGQAYTLVYRSDRPLPDGTLRPVRLFYRAAKTASGEAEVFIRGMVVPGPVWARLFLLLTILLAGLAAVPAWKSRRRRRPLGAPPS